MRREYKVNTVEIQKFQGVFMVDEVFGEKVKLSVSWTIIIALDFNWGPITNYCIDAKDFERIFLS